MNKEVTIKIKATGKVIKAYRSSRRQAWISMEDYRTEYTDNEVQVIES